MGMVNPATAISIIFRFTFMVAERWLLAALPSTRVWVATSVWLPKAAFSAPGVIADGFEDAPIGNGPFKMKGTWQHDTQIVVEKAVRYVEQHPFIDLFALYPPDGSQRGVQCQCQSCAKLTSTDRYLILINSISMELAKRPRMPKLMWIEYNECGLVPRNALPHEHGRNMVLLWCNDLRVHDQPFDSEANEHVSDSVPAEYRRHLSETAAPGQGRALARLWLAAGAYFRLCRLRHYSELIGQRCGMAISPCSSLPGLG